MANYYIAPTGNDTTGNGTVGTPWLTTSKANTSSTTGDTIYLLAGTYTFTAANYPMIGNRTYIGADPNTTILDGGGATITNCVMSSATSANTIKSSL